MLVEGAEIKFLCALCHKVCNILNAGGLHSISSHGSKKHPNKIPLDALEVGIAYVRKASAR
jgi:hypothetical protein